MALNFFVVAVLLLTQSGPNRSVTPQVSSPSQAFAYANALMEEWNAAIKAGKRPRIRTAPTNLVWWRANALCSSFPLESVAGEELYWLAKLCEVQPAKALPAAEKYFAGNGLPHEPEARLLLAEPQVKTTRNWESVWGTL